MALFEIAKENYPRVQPLFTRQMEMHLFCAGVLSGKYPGTVVADDPEVPHTAMVYTALGMWAFLGGDPGNTGFLQELGGALAKKQYITPDSWGILFNIPSEEWRPVLDKFIEGRTVIPTPRHLFLANRAHFNPPPPLPDGYTLHFIDATLPAAVDGELPGDCREVITLREGSADPDTAAFGYVAVRDRRCASWSVVDRIVGTHGEIGLYTEPDFRKAGLGMAVSGATIAYGLAHGLSDIHWDVISHNVPSIRMAEKHGLELARTYDQNFLIFGEVSYLANLAWRDLDDGEFQRVLEYCGKLLELEKGQRYGNFLSGAAWAGLGDREQAFKFLHCSVDAGWDDVGEMENCSPLRPYHGLPEWGDLLERIRARSAM